MAQCIFCRIVNKEIPSAILHEDGDILAFKDIDPKAPVHILIIPKKHVAKLMDFSSEDIVLMAKIHAAAQQIAKTEGVAETGFRLVTNNGAHAGQAVDHFHYHLLGGRKLGWPPG